MIELLFIPFFAAMLFLRGYGVDEKPWHYWRNLFTSKGAVSLYVFVALALHFGGWVWPAFTALMLLTTTWTYDKGKLLSWLPTYSGGHADKTHSTVFGFTFMKPAHWLTTRPLRRFNEDYAYGVAAGLFYAVAMAPWGMPLLPLLYGVIYKYAPNDEIGRTLLGLCLGLTFIL